MNFFGVKLGLSGTAEFKSGLEGAKKSVDDFKKHSAHAGEGAGIGHTLKDLVGAEVIRQAISGIMEFAERVETLSRRFGVSTEAIQKWGRAAEQNGSSMDGMAVAMNKLTINQSKALAGDEALREAFANLGVTLEDLGRENPDALMERISQSSLEAADMVAVFGKTGMEVVPVMQSVADGAVALGDAIDEGTIKALAAGEVRMKRFKNQMMVMAGDALNWASKIAATLGAAVMAKDGAEFQRARKEIWHPTEEGEQHPEAKDREIKDTEAEKRAAERKKKDDEDAAHKAQEADTRTHEVAMKHLEEQFKFQKEADDERKKAADELLTSEQRITALRERIAHLGEMMQGNDPTRAAELDATRAKLESDLQAEKKKSADAQEKANQLDADAHQEQAERSKKFDEKAAEDFEKQIDEKLKPADQRRQEKRDAARRARASHSLSAAEREKKRNEEANRLDHLNDPKKPDTKEERPPEKPEELIKRALEKQTAALSTYLENIETNTKKGLAE